MRRSRQSGVARATKSDIANRCVYFARHLWQEYMFSNSNCHIRDWSYRNSFAALTELVFILQ